MEEEYAKKLYKNFQEVSHEYNQLILNIKKCNFEKLQEELKKQFNLYIKKLTDFEDEALKILSRMPMDKNKYMIYNEDYLTDGALKRRIPKSKK